MLSTLVLFGPTGDLSGPEPWDDERFRRLAADRPEPAAACLALPPRVFPAAVTALGAAGLAPGSRIVVEKPFGEDLQSARARNRLLAEVTDEQGCSGPARQLAVVGDRVPPAHRKGASCGSRRRC